MRQEGVNVIKVCHQLRQGKWEVKAVEMSICLAAGFQQCGGVGLCLEKMGESLAHRAVKGTEGPRERVGRGGGS